MKCRVCNESHPEHLFKMRTPFLERQYCYAVERCGGCGFVQAEGPANGEILGEVYGHSFHDTSQQHAEVRAERFFTDEGLRFPVVRNAIARADWLQGLGYKGRLLDIGAGKGYFVKAAERYFEAQGIEISSAAIKTAQDLGADVRPGDFESLDFGEDRFDVVTLWDVVAGFRDPHRVFERLSTMLVAGGTLVFTVPRVTSAAAKVLRRYWPMYIPPVNLSYFSEKSLLMLLELHGYDPLLMECHSKRVAADFVLLKFLRAMGVANAAEVSGRFRMTWSVPINVKDILTVVARKRPIEEGSG